MNQHATDKPIARPHGNEQHSPRDNYRAAPLDMDEIKVDPSWALRIPSNLAVRRQVLPFAMRDEQVHVACANPDDAAALAAVHRYVRIDVVAEAAEPESLKRAIGRVYGDATSNLGGAARFRTVDVRQQSIDIDDDDAVALCDEVLHAAVLRQASDIHIDPQHDCVRLRFRVDGVLEHYRDLPPTAHAAMVSRLKVLSGLDIAEKRAPQDGGFAHKHSATGKPIDVRTATLPTKYGERMTLRLLALQTESLTLEKLGMAADHLTLFEEAINKPHGLILLTGPTGSGKTTTLYAAIRRLIAHRALNVLTIEDPIEYDINGVAQTEVDSADKVSFTRALRSVLRHDPDVIMIGEIRDRESADIAIKAALTGHLVFSTLHTNSAATAITRLADMGVERYLVAATVRLVVAQRLVRRLCPRCRSPRALTEAEAGALGRLNAAGETVHEKAGCLYCADRGYSGRVGLFEMINTDEEWATLIARGAEKADLVARMRKTGLRTLVDDAAEKVLRGGTSVPEALTAVSAW